MLTSKATLNTGRFDKLERQLSEATGITPIRMALRDCGAMYFGDMQARFRLLSKGGGEWPELKPSTLENRKYKQRKRGGSGTTDILSDTLTLYRALDAVWAARPGKLFQDIPFGVRVGYGGGDIHPESGLTIAALARLQNFGFTTRRGGVVPARRIITQPSEATKGRMRGRLRQAILEIFKA